MILNRFLDQLDWYLITVLSLELIRPLHVGIYAYIGGQFT